jgi:endogenous inhibitor of DNA gyrase (YacG/DUF329 family)
MGRRESREFNGKLYHRYPDSPQRAHRVYFTAHRGSLHRAIWEDAHGPVPEGYEVHHVDHNPLNNDLSNLAAIPQPEHRSESQAKRELHDYICAECGGAFQAYGNRRAERRFCSRKCKQDHTNRRLAAKARAEREVPPNATPHVCDECGSPFLSKPMPDRKHRYCSRRCNNIAKNRRETERRRAQRGL